jgi:crossover junction endodeoxyribonuclease RusA
MEPVTITIPHKPVSLNRYWLQRRPSGRYLSKEALTFRAATADAAGVREKLQGPLSIVIEAHWGKLGADADNTCKATLDALTHAGVWQDDGQVCSVTARRYLDRKRPRVVVHITRETDAALVAALPPRFGA